MNIVVDDLTGPEIAGLLQEHLDDMYATSPAESVHALDLNALQQPNITFWSLWKAKPSHIQASNDASLAGCIAVKELSPKHGEIKSMRTSFDFKNQGIASNLLKHLLSECEKRGYSKLSLETGSMDYFTPARQLYKKFGFKECQPFADYKLDPNSIFMEICI